jgi:hypothetical protein
MGKILVGRFGQPPEAESIPISLRDCHQRLGMKPTDFISAEPPSFFEKKVKGAMGRYVVFQAEVTETKDVAVWQTGYYLLPLDAVDVLKAFNRQDVIRGGGGTVRPFKIESKKPLTDAVSQWVPQWVERSQPLLLKCRCPELQVTLDAPTFIRKRWKARLSCPKKCQPVIKALF